MISRKCRLMGILLAWSVAGGAALGQDSRDPVKNTPQTGKSRAAETDKSKPKPGADRKTRSDRPESDTQQQPSGKIAEPRAANDPAGREQHSINEPAESAGSNRSSPFEAVAGRDEQDTAESASRPAAPLLLPEVDEAGTQRPRGADDRRDSDRGTPLDTQATQRDDELIRTQSPGRQNPAIQDPGSSLSTAREPPPGSTLPRNYDSTPADPMVLPAERLNAGPNTVGIKVEVGAPEFANLNLETEFWIRVKNVGPSDAMGVVVRYPLPDGLQFVDSEPVADPRSTGELVIWQINTMPSGTEKMIKVRVRPLKKATFEHAVTVQLLGGSRARTTVRQPQLKVEVRPSKLKPLKGEPVTFDISVTNVGDHPARNVMVQASLSAGLRHPEGQELKLSLKRELGVDAIAPNETVPLKLEVDTSAMGEQTCRVAVSSDDITEAVIKQESISVVAPDLKLAIEGPTERYPDTLVTYRVTIKNEGTTSARRVRVAASIPPEGKTVSATPEPVRSSASRLDWSVAELHPGASETFNIQVRMGKVGQFTLNAAAVHEGLRESIKASHRTDIRGIPKLRMTVNEPRGVLDEGEESTYEIRIRNDGTKEATGVIVIANVSPNMEIIGLEGGDARAGNTPPEGPNKAVFPQIDSLAPQGEVTLAIRVKAVRAGNATCQVVVRHSDAQEAALSQSIVTRVTSAAPAGTLR